MTVCRYLLVGLVFGCVVTLSILALIYGRPASQGVASLIPEPGQPVESDDPDPTVETIHLRIRAKNRIVDGLADDHLSLLSAAALFRELDSVSPPAVYAPETSPNHPLQLTSPTEAEWYCGQVILYTRGTLGGDQLGRMDAVTERLVAEFWAEKRKQGVVRLPESNELATVRRTLGFGPNDWPSSVR